MIQSYGSMLINSIADSAALASSTSQTTILPAAAIFTMPANYLKYAGADHLIIRAHGRVSTVVTNPGTLTFFVKIGSVNAAASTALTLNTTAQTNTSWWLEWDLTARAVGASTSTTLMHQGTWMSRAVVGSAAAASGGAGSVCLVDSAPAVGTGWDATAAQTVDLQAQWSVSNASNSILTHSYCLIAM